MLHKTYLPFTEQQLLDHFADVKRMGVCAKNTKHLNYYKESIQRYAQYLANNRDRLGKPLRETRFPCQIEKDERFWIAACMMTVFHSRNSKAEFIGLFEDTYGNRPPITMDSWEECFEGALYLFFEANLPSPRSYRNGLRENFTKRNFIPHVRDSANSKKNNLEGPTNVDAMLLNSENGFAVIIEAKVLSDISYEVTYDCMRNQIARSIDVMLEKNDRLCPPLNKRDPQRTLFLLVTPQLFKQNPESRLYGYKFNEYKKEPRTLANDLAHRKGCNWQSISNRLGWLTWEDFRTVNNSCCPWLVDIK